MTEASEGSGPQPAGPAAPAGGRDSGLFWLRVAAILGCIAAVACLWIAASDRRDAAVGTGSACRTAAAKAAAEPFRAALDASARRAATDALARNAMLGCADTALALGALPSDKAGQLRIVGVYPERVEINQHLIAVVAGVVSVEDETAAATRLAAAKETRDASAKAAAAAPGDARAAADLQQALAAYDAAVAAMAIPAAPVDLQIFLDGRKSPFTVPVKAISGPQPLRFGIDSPQDYSSDAARFWREVLSGVWSNGGSQAAVLGLSRASQVTTLPDAVAPKDMAVTIQVFTWPAVGAGAAAVLLFAAAFLLFARRTTVLRENGLTVAALRKLPEADRPDGWERYLDGRYHDRDAVGPYSLGLSQMAVWGFMVIACFLYIALTLGQFLNLISDGVLTLLGLTGVAAVAATQINARLAADAPSKVSQGFFTDVIASSEQTGPEIQRLQTLAWTVILGGIFLWVAASSFSFVEFDTGLLLLMGIAQTLYIGFKARELNSDARKPEPKE